MQFRPSPSNQGAWTFPKDKKLDCKVVSSDHRCSGCGKPLKLRVVRSKKINKPTRCYRCHRAALGLMPEKERKRLRRERRAGLP